LEPGSQSLRDLLVDRGLTEKEVLYQQGDEYDEDIDLSPDLNGGRVQVLDVTVGELRDFRNRFDPLYLGDLDDGEAESLAYMMMQATDFLISSGDAIVYRVLGNMNLANQGISLEEILQKIGMGRGLEWPYSKAFREKYTKVGEVDMVQGRGYRR
jgi:hypothetical protein